jgi:hypothetical protein
MRKDGIRVKDANPIYTVMPYILKYRYDAMNMIEVDIPISPMQTYLNENASSYRFASWRRARGLSRTAADYPLSTRFNPNKRIYQRNEFSIAMVV